uniref:Endonuclease/exonuclease/phosphatase domain-containing protein n=1 Tax=Plectus sambesii TaxID=2011161 RepID=A0A914XHR6_9BILA
MDLANIIKEKSNIKCDILGLSETRRQKKTAHTLEEWVDSRAWSWRRTKKAAEDEEVKRFYEELEEAMNTCCTYLIVMGDFNAKVGCRKDNEAFVGPFGGERNERGEWLAAIAESRRLFVGNSFFKKRHEQRWMWILPNGETKNEIDYILCSHHRILQDIGVVGKAFTTGSDHRLV